MKLHVASADTLSGTKTVRQIASVLRSGTRMKFVPAILANVQDEEFVLLICIAERGEHQQIMIRGRDTIDRKLFFRVDMPSQGGGYVQITDDHLVFDGTSSGLGDYSKDLMRKVPNSVYCTTFNVSAVYFE